jgi:hypothetical protein
VFPSTPLLVTTARPAQAIRKAGGMGQEAISNKQEDNQESV